MASAVPVAAVVPTASVAPVALVALVASFSAKGAANDVRAATPSASSRRAGGRDLEAGLIDVPATWVGAQGWRLSGLVASPESSAFSQVSATPPNALKKGLTSGFILVAIIACCSSADELLLQQWLATAVCQCWQWSKGAG